MAGLIPIEDLIERLKLEPLQGEGGFFRITYRSPEWIDSSSLSDPLPRGGLRQLSGAIYYLITPSSFSALHRLRSDEIYHFYYGDAVEQLLLFEEGTYEVARMGTDLLTGETPQRVVPAGVWQGTRLSEGGSYALLGTTMAPAFHEEDFELGACSSLIRFFPEAAELIRGYTYD